MHNKIGHEKFRQADRHRHAEREKSIREFALQTYRKWYQEQKRIVVQLLLAYFEYIPGDSNIERGRISMSNRWFFAVIIVVVFVAAATVSAPTFPSSFLSH